MLWNAFDDGMTKSRSVDDTNRTNNHRDLQPVVIFPKLPVVIIVDIFAVVVTDTFIVTADTFNMVLAWTLRPWIFLRLSDLRAICIPHDSWLAHDSVHAARRHSSPLARLGVRTITFLIFNCLQPGLELPLGCVVCAVRSYKYHAPNGWKSVIFLPTYVAEDVLSVHRCHCAQRKKHWKHVVQKVKGIQHPTFNIPFVVWVENANWLQQETNRTVYMLFALDHILQQLQANTQKYSTKKKNGSTSRTEFTVAQWCFLDEYTVS